MKVIRVTNSEDKPKTTNATPPAETMGCGQCHWAKQRD